MNFEALDSKQQARLRRLYHRTSAQTALRIIRSGHLWSKDPAGFANLSIRRNPDPGEPMDRAPEVSMTFEFSGTIRLVPFDFDTSMYQPNILYAHLAVGRAYEHGATPVIGILRLAAGSTFGLNCVGLRYSRAYLRRCQDETRVAAIYNSLEQQISAGRRAIRVPASKEEAALIAKRYPPFNPGITDIARLKLMELWHWRAG